MILNAHQSSLKWENPVQGEATMYFSSWLMGFCIGAVLETIGVAFGMREV